MARSFWCTTFFPLALATFAHALRLHKSVAEKEVLTLVHVFAECENQLAQSTHSLHWCSTTMCNNIFFVTVVQQEFAANIVNRNVPKGTFLVWIQSKGTFSTADCGACCVEQQSIGFGTILRRRIGFVDPIGHTVD